jgi:RimK family alpha-L-glutamate ligase
MHLVVLASAESWYLNDLRRAAAGRHEISSVDFGDLVSTISENQVYVGAKGMNLGDSDAVLVRTMAPGSLEQIVFRMDALGQLAASGLSIINPPRAIEAAVDKYLTTARLAAAGLPVPCTIACQTAEEGMAAFEMLGGDVVIKPVFGSEGRGIMRLVDAAVARQAFQAIARLGGLLYVQQFIPHDGFDIRVLVIGQRMFAIRRRNDSDWRTNVSRGAIAEPTELTGEMATMARQAADAIGAPIAGVDLLPGRDGRLYAIEVNAVPGWKALAAALDIDIARAVLEHVEQTVNTGPLARNPKSKI